MKASNVEASVWSALAKADDGLRQTYSSSAQHGGAEEGTTAALGARQPSRVLIGPPELGKDQDLLSGLTKFQPNLNAVIAMLVLRLRRTTGRRLWVTLPKLRVSPHTETKTP